jgi:hypothetical protein
VNATTELILEHLTGQGVIGRMKPVPDDRGVTSAAAQPARTWAR